LTRFKIQAMRCNDGILSGVGIGYVARPAITIRLVHHACTNRVQFGVVIASEQIAMLLHETPCNALSIAFHCGIAYG
jgi:hypothetical protein